MFRSIVQIDKPQRLGPLAAAVAFGLGLAAIGYAGEGTIAAASAPAPHPGAPKNLDARGLMLKGYDPVAYFIDGVPRRGAPAFQARWNGALYRFASREARDAFVADPIRYAPQYGGFDAFGLRHGERRDVDPEFFAIIGGRLFLLADKDAKARWTAQRRRSIEVADAIWPQIASLLEK